MKLFLTTEQKAARDDAASAAEELDSLRSSDSKRLQRFTTHTNEYEEARRVDSWQFANDDYGTKPKGATSNKLHHIPLPYGHAITTKHAFRVGGRMPDISCPRLDSSPPERYRADTKEKLVYAAYGHSRAEVQIMSGALDGSLHGAACFDLYWNPQRQLPCFRSISPGGIVVVGGIDDPHSYKRVYRWWRVSAASFRMEYKGIDLPGGQTAQDVKVDEDGTNMVTISEQVDSNGDILRFAGDVLLERQQRDYGFCPYYVIPNLGPVRNIFGYSDYEFYRGLVKYYEVAVSRQADVLRGAAGGAYSDTGSGQSANTVKRVLREGGLLPMRPDSEIKPIEVAKQPDFTEAHLADIKTAIKEIAFAPDASWGTLGAATSGTDRALQIAPQIELTALKQIHWTAGLQRINEGILRLIESKTAGKQTYKGRQGPRRTPYAITLNAASDEMLEMVDSDGMELIDPVSQQPYVIPSSPKDLIDGDYETDVKWQRRLERDDPQWVLSRLNLFSQAAISLYTLLDELGYEAPEDEIKRIEDESKRFPWMRQGLVKLISDQIAAEQNQQNPSDQSTPPGGDIAGAMASLAGGGGGGAQALGFDAQTQALNGSDNAGTAQTNAPAGAPYGGA